MRLKYLWLAVIALALSFAAFASLAQGHGENRKHNVRKQQPHNRYTKQHLTEHHHQESGRGGLKHNDKQDCTKNCAKNEDTLIQQPPAPNLQISTPSQVHAPAPVLRNPIDVLIDKTAHQAKQTARKMLSTQ